MEHHFNVEAAEKYGLSEAVMLHNIAYWVQVNAANDTNHFEGKYWTYNSRSAYAKLFPYWSEDQIKRILKSLKDQGAIEDGCFNRDPFDKTKWYTITESAVGYSAITDWVKSPNLDWVKSPNHYTDNKPDEKPSLSLPLGVVVRESVDHAMTFDRFWSAYPKKSGKEPAKKVWMKLKPTAALMDTILKAIGVQRETDQWKKDKGQYIPMASTWLNQKRWEDEVLTEDSTPAWVREMKAEHNL